MARKIKLKIKQLLVKNKMTQKEVAEKAGVRENTIGDLMKDNRTTVHFETLEKVAKVLKVERISELLDFEEDENTEDC